MPKIIATGKNLLRTRVTVILLAPLVDFDTWSPVSGAAGLLTAAPLPGRCLRDRSDWKDYRPILTQPCRKLSRGTFIAWYVSRILLMLSVV
jgi:hypothetical protein